MVWGISRESVLKMEVVSTGYLNAVCFWFDLHLDEEESLTSAPRGIGKGGQIVGELKREDTATVQAQINASMARFKATLAANPRTDLGAMVRAAARRRRRLSLSLSLCLALHGASLTQR